MPKIRNCIYLSMILLIFGPYSRANSQDAQIQQKLSSKDSTKEILLSQYKKINDSYEKLEFCKKIIKEYKDQDIKNSFYNKGFFLSSRNLKFNDNKVITWCENWVIDCPNNFLAHYRISTLYSKNKRDLDKAIFYMNNAIKLSPSRGFNLGAKYDICLLYFDNKMYDKTIVSIEEYINYSNRHPGGDLIKRLGVSYGKIGELDLALETIAIGLSFKNNERFREYFNQFYLEKYGSLDGANNYLENIPISKAKVEPFTVPDFKLLAITGDSVKWSSFRGKVVLLCLWTSG